jgi:Tol biopolymer transport system component
VVLYEMVTRTLPFKGDTAGAIFNEILNKAPTPPVRLNPDVPDELGRVISKCLEKDTELRYQSASELRADLKRLKRDTTSGAAAAPPAPRLRGRRRGVLPWAAAGLLVVVGALGWWLLSTRAPSAPTAPPKFTSFTTDGGFKSDPALSPDGERVAYTWAGAADDNWDIYVKALGAGAEPLRLTEDPARDRAPAWSPDGRQIAFVRESDDGIALYTVPSMGGQERRLGDGSVPRPGLSWSPDGRSLVFAEQATRDETARIVRLSLETLEKQPLTSPPEGSRGDLFAGVSPDGRQVAFARTSLAGVGALDLWVQPLEGGEARQLTSGDYERLEGLAWTPDGEAIVFAVGEGGDVAPGVYRVRLAGGEPEPLVGVGHGAAHPCIVGNRMVYSQTTAFSYDMWRIPGRGASRADRVPNKLISSSTLDGNPAYSPDGRKIAFASGRGGNVNNIWVAAADGSHPVQLTRFEDGAGTARWSPDGRKLVVDSRESGNYDLFVVDAGGGIPGQLTRDPSDDIRGVFSADGEWVYFGSSRGGTWRIWKIPAEGGEAIQVTRGESFDAQLSRDGRYVYFSKGTPPSIWRIPVAGGEEAEVFRAALAPTDPRDWVLTPSGIYFATIQDRGRAQDYTIQFFDLESGEVTDLFQGEGLFGGLPIAVSPDEAWILYAQKPLSQSELMLVENFR